MTCTWDQSLSFWHIGSGGEGAILDFRLALTAAIDPQRASRPFPDIPKSGLNEVQEKSLFQLEYLTACLDYIKTVAYNADVHPTAKKQFDKWCDGSGSLS